MRVLMTTTYWKGCQGGVRTYVVNLVQELLSRGVDVKVAFKEGIDPENYKISETSIFPVKTLKAFRLLRKVKPDVVHSHGGMYYYLIAGYAYRMIYGVRLVYTFHTEPTPGNNLSFLRRSFLQMLLSRCDKVTFVSEGLQVKVREIWGLDLKNTAITYAGAGSKEVSNDDKRKFCDEFGIDSGSIILLALGLTSMSYKAEGLKLLIKAVKEVEKRYPDITLIATGKGIFFDELKEFANLEGADSVIFVGDVKNPYIPLALCDIYTHISLGEGLPVALLEAMSMGKPIIATSVGGIPEAIEDGQNGILTPPDVDKIAEKIIYLIENPGEAEKLGRRARQTLEERFTWRASADKFIEIYSGNL